MLQLFADTFLQILDSKHFTGIKFSVLFLGAVKFNDIHCIFTHKQIFAVLEQIVEIASICTLYSI